MNHCYKETALDLVIMVNEDGTTRAAAEFIIEGTYLETDKGLQKQNNNSIDYPLKLFLIFKIIKLHVSPIITIYKIGLIR
jgi:hypothetical protein